MDIYVLSQDFKKLDIIDYCASVIWTRRYCKAGDFELYLPITAAAVKVLTPGNYLVRSDMPDNLMVIQGVKITTDEEDGDYLTVTGQGTESIIAKRIVWEQTNLNGTITAAAQKLLNENVIKPTDTARKIAVVEIGDCCQCAMTITKQITGTNLLDAIIDLLSPYKLGFKVVFTGSSLKFCIYNGVDRSADQSDRPRVVFNADFDNLLASEYTADISEYKNIALVAGEGEGVQRKTYTVGNASGLDRIETYVDARDISSEVDGGKLTTAEYNELLKAKGVEALAETITKQSFEGTIEPTVNYTFGVDYDLGDIVQITNEYGITAPARITEVIESWSDTGYSCIPTFSSEEV